MKITYFSYLYDIKGVSAGSANKAIGFIGGLNAIGHDATIFWRSDQPEDYTGDSIRIRIRHRLKRLLSRFIHDPKKCMRNAKYLIQEYWIIKKEKPDLLLLRPELYGFSAALLSCFFHIPVVLEADAPIAYEHRFLSGRDKIKLGYLPEWIERWNWKISRHIIAISEVLRNYLSQQGVPAQKITMIPNGADPNTFRPGLDGKRIRQQLGIDDRLVIGWAGSLFGWSGLENLLNMTKRILHSRKDVVFLFVTGGKNKQVVETTFSSELGIRVFLTGTVSYGKVPRYMNAMDIVVVPYPKLDFWYPSSMKLFEYMSSGKAVVASAVDQVKEVIQDGENGLLFEPNDVNEFVNKILLLVDDPVLRKRLERKARKTVLEKYSWVGHARKMEDIFNSVLKQS